MEEVEPQVVRLEGAASRRIASLGMTRPRPRRGDVTVAATVPIGVEEEAIVSPGMALVPPGLRLA